MESMDEKEAWAVVPGAEQLALHVPLSSPGEDGEMVQVPPPGLVNLSHITIYTHKRDPYVQDCTSCKYENTSLSEVHLQVAFFCQLFIRQDWNLPGDPGYCRHPKFTTSFRT